ncbi:MAG: tetratricopeptide repeat protein [Balneolaceae bacterium]
MKPLLFALFTLLITAASLNDARKANQAYHDGDYETAAELYRTAIQQSPDDERLHFNLATTLAKMDQHEEAMEVFNEFKRLAEQPEKRSMADYNVGAMLSDMELYEQAADFFRQALIENPDDLDARFNYELAKRKQQEQEDDQDQDQDQNENDDDSDSDSDPDSDQENDDQDQEQDQDQNEDQNQPQDQQQDPSQQPQPQDLSREEAESLLNALEQLERELLENQKKDAAENRTQNDKDW